MDYRSLAKSASGRRNALQAKIASTKEDLTAMEKELVVLDGILKAIPAGELKRAGRPAGKRAARRGRWKPGGRGRPPKAYVEARKGKGKAGKKAPARKPTRKKRKPSEKQLAAMAKARAALAAKRAAAKKAAE